ncbi:MAG: tetratricopeptide repeat protein [Deltaproteobacteria bacterium]|nr:tetratricopeptide repeat protein [Deltaproteobacteria bacterium]
MRIAPASSGRGPRRFGSCASGIGAARWECMLLVAPSVRKAALLSIAVVIGHARTLRGEPADDADRALAAGAFRDALAAYRKVLAASPRDHHALREAGRAAHALRDFAAAAELLAQADAVAGAPDPELHFLLGEALWTLGRGNDATAAHRRVLAELATAPRGRLERLWLARCFLRLDERAAAEAVYAALVVDHPDDAEIAFAQTEMYAAARRWADAEQAIRRFLGQDPRSIRARALLAWIDEARGHLDDEIATRAELAHGRDADATTLRDYGRALERSRDWAGARAAYARAAVLPGAGDDVELAAALERVDRRMSIELGAGGVARSDPSGSSLGAFTGVAVPFGRAHHATVIVSGDQASSPARTVSTGEVTGAVHLRGSTREVMAGMQIGWLAEPDGMSSRTLVGAVGALRAELGTPRLRLAVDGELRSVWRETPLVELLGGSQDALTTHVYATALDNRLVFDVGAGGRLLHFGDAGARQGMAWAGADFVVWRDFAHEARGQILDDDLRYAATAADSLVVGYRHHEVGNRADDAFTASLALAPRASIDEVSATARKVLSRGRITLELRGGLGRDRIRDLALMRGGVSLWIAPGRSSRLALSMDVVRESIETLQGGRRLGWVSYHVDL